MNESYDVIVAGAGPAGVAASVVIKQAGFSVLLIDSVKPDQLKVGESVPGAALRLLQRLGLESIDALLDKDAYVDSTANASAWGSDQWTFQDAIKNPDGGGWHVLRHRFDEQLRAYALKCGVEYNSGQLNRFKQEAEGGFTLSLISDKQTLRCQWLIDATGRKAMIARKLGSERKRFSEQYAVIAWINSPPHDHDQMTRVKSVPEGWWYTSKLPGGLRVIALQCTPEKATDLVKQPADFCHAWTQADILDLPLSPEDLVQPLVARDASVQLSTAPAGGNWLAVGDAALSFDPLSSQGIFFALYSGVRGGEAVVNSLKKPEETSTWLHSYQQRVQSVFQANMRSRNLFYRSELRFREEVYWQRQTGVS